MRIRWILSLLLLLGVALPVAAQMPVDEIVFQIDNIAVRSDYDAATGELVWSQGAIAVLKHASGEQKYRVTIDGTWSGVTDNSSGTVAAASFDTGSFDIVFFAMTDPTKSTPLADLSGVLFPGYTYEEAEQEENPTKLYGAAPIRLTTWNVPGYVWAEDVGPAGAMGGLTATTTNLFSNWGNIDDYAADWWSTNTIVTILADESGIPEPMTIALLGLGALGLLRKRS
jgi:hypothetical protein